MWVQMVGGSTCSLGSSQLLALPLVRVELVPYGRAVLLLKEQRGSTGGGGVLGRRREQQIEGALAHTGTHMHTCTHTCHSVQGLTEVAARPVYARPVVSSSSPVFARVLPLALPSSPADDTTHAQ